MPTSSTHSWLGLPNRFWSDAVPFSILLLLLVIYFFLDKMKRERKQARRAKKNSWNLDDEATRKKIQQALMDRVGPYAGISDEERSELLALLSKLDEREVTGENRQEEQDRRWKKLVACKRKLEDQGKGLKTLGQMEKLLERFGMPLKVKVPDTEKKMQRSWKYFANHFLSQGVSLPMKYRAEDWPDHQGFCDFCDTELTQEQMVTCSTCQAVYCSKACRSKRPEDCGEEEKRCCYLGDEC